MNEAQTWECKPVTVLRNFLTLLQPFAPHLAEELWAKLQSKFPSSAPPISYAPWPKFDPAMLAITPPYTATFNSYVRSELGVETDLTYETLSGKVHEKWQWENGVLPSTSAWLMPRFER